MAHYTDQSLKMTYFVRGYALRCTQMSGWNIIDTLSDDEVSEIVGDAADGETAVARFAAYFEHLPEHEAAVESR